MLQDLRDAFRKAVKNFRAELHRDDVPGSVDELLHGMRQELIDARSYISRLEEEILRTLELAEREGTEAEVCRRREAMARKIEDEETAALAGEFGEKHERRREVLDRKALALKEELEVRRAEADEMVEVIRTARTRRDELAATLGRAGSRETIREADDLFSELDRMAEKISELEHRNAAEEELRARDPLFRDPLEDDEELEELERRAPSPADMDARLRELKRRMDDSSTGS